MPLDERLRHNLAAAIMWLAFLALYLGGAILLMIGLVFAWRQWWEIIHQHTGAWLIGGKTAALAVLAMGCFLVLIIPLLQRHEGNSRAWKRERRSEMKSGLPVAESQ